MNREQLTQCLKARLDRILELSQQISPLLKLKRSTAIRLADESNLAYEWFSLCIIGGIDKDKRTITPILHTSITDNGRKTWSAIVGEHELADFPEVADARAWAHQTALECLPWLADEYEQWEINEPEVITL